MPNKKHSTIDDMSVRDQTNKMMTNDKLVVTCLICGRSFIIGRLVIPDVCPACSNKDNIVINNQYIVVKGV